MKHAKIEAMGQADYKGARTSVTSCAAYGGSSGSALLVLTRDFRYVPLGVLSGGSASGDTTSSLLMVGGSFSDMKLLEAFLSGDYHRATDNFSDQIPLRAVESRQIGRFGYIDPTDGGDAYRYSVSGSWQRLGERSIALV